MLVKISRSVVSESSKNARKRWLATVSYRTSWYLTLKDLADNIFDGVLNYTDGIINASSEENYSYRSCVESSPIRQVLREHGPAFLGHPRKTQWHYSTVRGSSVTSESGSDTIMSKEHTSGCCQGTNQCSSVATASHAYGNRDLSHR